MALTQLSTSSVKLLDPSFIILTPYNASGTIGDNHYKLEEVLADSTALEQEEPSSTPIECEFSSTPLHTRTTGGSTTFTCQVADFQETFLKTFLGYKTITGSGSTVTQAYKPTNAPTIKVKIDLVYDLGDNKYQAITLPMVTLNSSLAVSSLKSSIALVTLTGNVAAGKVGATENMSELVVDYDYTMPE